MTLFCPRKLAALFFSLVLASQTHAQVTRDWKRFPAIMESSAPKTLYALGDVHGDYDRLVELLTGAKLIAANPQSPAEVRWTGGKAVMVCTGDMIDKYDHAMSVIALLRALQPQAIHDGGLVVVTMGNHEAEFLAGGGADRKAVEFVDELQSAGVSPIDVAEGKDTAGIGEWLRELPIAAKVGDWFFCHAGNTGGLSTSQLDEEIQSQISANGFGSSILVGDDSLLEARMHPRPWWDWDGQTPALKDEKSEKLKHASKKSSQDPGEVRLRSGIEALGAHHLVFGHQPGKIKFADGTERAAGEMYEKFDGLVFLIDTGMSRGVASGRGALLRISAGSVHGATAVYADGTTRTLVP